MGQLVSVTNQSDADDVADVDVGEYCRHVESHLAQVNAGEIIRITGAGFELVRSWALEGIPLSIVCHAVSQKAERHRTGRSTRPLRIEFCTADVREVYRTWRRAVGIRSTDGAMEDEARAAAPAGDKRRASLGRHLQRAIDRLSQSASRLDLAPDIRDALDAVLQDVAAISEQSRGARGPARESIVSELAALDARMLATVRTGVGAAEIDRLSAEAAADLGAYRGRLAPDVWQRSVNLGVDRLLRGRLGLPTLEL
jgi:hypothetical protein